MPTPILRRLLAATATAVVAVLGAAGASVPAAAAPAPAPAPASPPAPVAGTEDRSPALTAAPGPFLAAATTAATAAGTEGPAAGATLAAEEGLAPFELVGVTLAAPADPVLVRVRQSGRWGAWHELGFEEGDGETGGDRREGVTSAPLWVGPADGYQVLLPPGAADPVVHVVRETGVPRAAVAAGVTAAATTPQAYASSPGVLSRAAWGARPMNGQPVEADDLRLAIVHHSVSVNGYDASQVPGMLRAIQAYHMDAHGWSDVGYNFAVDRFGRIWELRAGGILNAVIGGHSQGFNTGSVGVVLLGDHSSVAPSTAATNAVAEIIAWRFAVAQSDPRGLVDYTTVSGSTRFPPGTTVRINRVSAHRDVGSTACPGAVAYGAMTAIRSRVASRYAALAGTTLTRWLTSVSHRYSDLHGVAVGAPDTVSAEPGDLDVYARGGDDQLFVTRWRGTGWSPWAGLGGRLTSAPAAVADPGGAVDVFAVGGDGAVWFRSLEDGAWSAWGTIGGRLTSAPEAIRTDGGEVVVAGRGGDGAVWLRVRDTAGRWRPWTTIGGGVQPGADPGLVTDGGTPTVLVTGGDGALWSRTGPLDAPSGWVRVGGLLTSGASAASVTDGRVDVVGRGGDLRMWTIRRVDGRWSGWQPVSRERVGAGAGITSWGPDRLDFATTSPDGRIFQNWWIQQTGW